MHLGKKENPESYCFVKVGRAPIVLYILIISSPVTHSKKCYQNLFWFPWYSCWEFQDGKMDSTVVKSAMDFSFSLAHYMIGNFSNRERTVQMHQHSTNYEGNNFPWVFHYLCFLCSLFIQEDWELYIYLLFIQQHPTVSPERKKLFLFAIL